jgi:hypothetical protein
MLIEAGADAAQAAPYFSWLVRAAVGLPEVLFSDPEWRLDNPYYWDLKDIADKCPNDAIHELPDHLVNEFFIKKEAKLIRRKVDAMARVGFDLAATINPKTGRLVLLDVAKDGKEAAVLALVRAGADASARDKDGWTALMLLINELGEWGDQRWQGKFSKVSATTVVALIRAGGGGGGSWDAIPYNFKGLECLLGFVHEKAPYELGQLFSKLPAATQAAVRETLQVLHRLLPGGEGLDQIRFKILAQAFEEEEEAEEEE